MKNNKYFIIFAFFIFLLNIKCQDQNDNKEKICKLKYYKKIYKPVYIKIESFQDSISFQDAQAPTEKGKIYFYKNYIFINKLYKGFHIFDKSDPLNPKNIGFLKVPGSEDLSIKNNMLYVDMFHALVTIDITDIKNPVVKKDMIIKNLFDNYYNNYILYDNNIYYRYNYKENDTIPFIDYGTSTTTEVATTTTDAKVSSSDYVPFEDIFVGYKFSGEITENYFDTCGAYNIYEITGAKDASSSGPVSSPTTASGSATSTGTSSTTGKAGSLARFLAIDNYLYTLNTSNALIFELADDGKPTKWANFEPNKNISTFTNLETIYTQNDRLFVGSTAGMFVYDIKDAGNPKFLSAVSHVRSCDPVVADNNYAYVTLRGGSRCFSVSNELHIYDLKEITKPELISTYSLFGPYGLAIQNDILFVCDGESGLKIFDVTDRKKPIFKTRNSSIFAYDIILENNIATIVTDKGLVIFTFTDPVVDFKKSGSIFW